MGRHLEACEQRRALEAEAGNPQKMKKSKVFHILVEGYRLPMYWLHWIVFSEIAG
jgi:hypothetical protein